MKIFRLLVLGLLLVGCDYAYGEGTETKAYCWGLGFNRVINMPDQKFIQVNGDVSFKFPNNKWLKDTYVYMGINTDGNFAGGVGYYLWKHRIGLQIGDIYTPSPNDEGEDNFCYGIFLGVDVINYIWDVIKKSGDIVFQEGK